MLLRLAYLTMTNTFAVLRLLTTSGREEKVEILTLRHQLAVLERQLHGARPRFTPADRAFLAALLRHPNPASNASVGEFGGSIIRRHIIWRN